MKSQKKKELCLKKVTIKNLDMTLDKDEQKKIKGGTGPCGGPELSIVNLTC